MRSLSTFAVLAVAASSGVSLGDEEHHPVQLLQTKVEHAASRIKKEHSQKLSAACSEPCKYNRWGGAPAIREYFACLKDCCQDIDSLPNNPPGTNCDMLMNGPWTKKKCSDKLEDGHHGYAGAEDAIVADVCSKSCGTCDQDAAWQVVWPSYSGDYTKVHPVGDPARIESKGFSKDACHEYSQSRIEDMCGVLEPSSAKYIDPKGTFNDRPQVMEDRQIQACTEKLSSDWGTEQCMRCADSCWELVCTGGLYYPGMWPSSSSTDEPLLYECQAEPRQLSGEYFFGKGDTNEKGFNHCHTKCFDWLAEVANWAFGLY